MNIVFGPVPSRRLGRSLGINIVPEKICSLDCLYCEVSKTSALTLKKAPYISAEKVLTEFNRQYAGLKDCIDIITVTGAGEPTLNSELDKIIEGIKAVAEHPVAILTNSTTLTEPAVAETLKKFDIVVPSLDAVTQEIFEKVDRPAAGVNVADIIAALISFSKEYSGKLYLELLLVKEVNDSCQALRDFAETAQKINYTKIQISTVFRPPAWAGTDRLTGQELEDAYLLLAKEGLRVEPVGAFSMAAEGDCREIQLGGLLENLLHLRPVTAADIAAGLGIALAEVHRLLSEIGHRQSICEREYDGEIYYSLEK